MSDREALRSALATFQRFDDLYDEWLLDNVAGGEVLEGLRAFEDDLHLLVDVADAVAADDVEVWWFCQSEGQRRKKFLACAPHLNCPPDRGCGIRLFVPVSIAVLDALNSQSSRETP